LSVDARAGAGAGTNADAGTNGGTSFDAGADAGTGANDGMSADAGAGANGGMSADGGADAGAGADAGTDAGTNGGTSFDAGTGAGAGDMRVDAFSGSFKSLIGGVKPCDWALLAILLAATLWGMAAVSGGAAASAEVVIEVANKPLYRLPLGVDNSIDTGGLVVEIKGRKVRVLTAECPNKLCVKQGWIEHGAIICVPLKTVIRIKERRGAAPRGKGGAPPGGKGSATPRDKGGAPTGGEGGLTPGDKGGSTPRDKGGAPPGGNGESAPGGKGGAPPGDKGVPDAITG